MQRIRMLMWLAAFCPAGLAAAILPVSSLGDTGPGSLRQQAELAASGDTLEFQVDGTVFLQTNLIISKSLTIMGLDAFDVIISGSGQQRLVEVSDQVTLVLHHLTLQGGYTRGLAQEGGGAIRNRGFVFAYNCLFLHNSAEYGGAIENISFGGDSSYLYLENCSFIGNKAVKGDGTTLSRPLGGAIFVDTRQYGFTEIEAINCTFSNNESEDTGGAIYLLEIPFGNSLTRFEHCTFANNKALLGCGGIDMDQGRRPIFKACVISENQGSAFYPNARGRFSSEGYNVFSDTTGFSFPQGLRNTDQTGISANLINATPFSPRRWLMATQCNSPCLDQIPANESKPTDQRGEPRVGPADVGAYERVESKDLGLFNSNNTGVGSLRFLIEFHCEGDTIHLDNTPDTIRLSSPIGIFRNVSILNKLDNRLVLHGNDSSQIFTISSTGHLFLSGLTLINGYSTNYGGGAIANRGSLHLRHSTFAYNQASGGGAISNYAQSGDTCRFLAEGCTFSHNLAQWLDGGALDNRSFGGHLSVNIHSCTFANNEAFVRGGAIFIDDGSDLILENTLVDLNLAPIGEQIYGSLASSGYNLIRTSEGTTGNIAPTDIIGQPSNLLPLADYGGTMLTHALSNQSVAIDNGKPGQPSQATDQRGVNRVYGLRQDIGAFEYDGTTSSELLSEIRTVQVFPNPSRSFTIKFQAFSGVVRLSLTNNLGQVVWTDQVNTDRSPEYYFSPDLPAGVYILNIQAPDFQEVFRLVIE